MSEVDTVVVREVQAVGLERALQVSPWRSIQRFRVWSYALIMLGPAAPLVFLSEQLDPGLVQVVIAALLMLLPLLALIWVQNAAWRTYLKENSRTPSGAEPDDWHIDTAGVSTSSPSLRFSAPWSGFADVRETATVIHFILTPSLVWVLPKRFVAEGDLVTLRRLIAEARDRGDVKGIPG